MSWIWLVLAFVASCAITWQTSGWMMKKALGRSMFSDIVKGLKTETLVKVQEQATDEITRRKSLLVEESAEKRLKE